MINIPPYALYPRYCGSMYVHINVCARVEDSFPLQMVGLSVTHVGSSPTLSIWTAYCKCSYHPKQIETTPKTHTLGSYSLHASRPLEHSLINISLLDQMSGRTTQFIEIKKNQILSASFWFHLNSIKCDSLLTEVLPRTIHIWHCLVSDSFGEFWTKFKR